MAETGNKSSGTGRVQQDLLDVTRGYTPLPGIPDEFLDARGQPREVWARFFEAFSALAPGEIERRFASADQHMREAGVTDEGLARLLAPIGLDLGARTPEETAVAICAEIIACQTGRAVPRLRDTDGPIHGVRP